ncbi:MAG: adenylate/guanylate cyclase domain-containing protein [Leptospiraceae bacterium]|nr:adenylate/guanylate cyclase domain-containing protein [Leptospiraceae bacterium]
MALPNELDTFDALVTRQMNETLQKGSLASCLMGFSSSLLLYALTLTGFVKGIEVPIVWTLIGGVYSGTVWLLARAGKIQSRSTWAVMLGFCTLPTTIYIMAYFVLPAGTATYITGPPGYLYFFLIVLTGFAFDFRLSLATGIYSGLQYSLAAHLAIPHLAAASHPDQLLVQDLTQETFYHFKSMMMGVTGFTVGIVSRHVRALIADTLVKQRETMMVSRLFGQFVSAEVKDKLLSGTGAAGHGEKKQVAILFCDIRGFTTFSENTPPENIVEYLNEYLDAMVQAINAAGGTIDKFIGDAVMAVFGGVLEVPNSCDAALAAALLMRAQLSELNTRRAARGLAPINNGIGIHYGEVLQGAIGSSLRKDFTVIGDAVNSASRLEGLCKDFATDLIFSDAVYAGASPAVQQRCRRLGEAKVKGREQPIALWSIDA